MTECIITFAASEISQRIVMAIYASVTYPKHKQKEKFLNIIKTGIVYHKDLWYLSISSRWIIIYFQKSLPIFSIYFLQFLNYYLFLIT